MFIKSENENKSNLLLTAVRRSNTDEDHSENGSLDDLMFHTPSFGEEEYSFLQDKPQINLKSSHTPDFPNVNTVFNNNYFDTRFTTSQNFSQPQTTDFLTTLASTQATNSTLYQQQQQHQQQQQKQQLQEQQQQQQQQTSAVHNLQHSFYNSKSPVNTRGYSIMSTERDSIFESLENIAPKFPPQDVDLPDISSTTNGVGTVTTTILNAGYSGGVVYEQASMNTAPRTHPDIGMHVNQPDSTSNKPIAATTVSPVSSTMSNMSNASPPLESSEDSDDSVPLAQLVKRQAHDEVPSPPKPAQKPAGVKKPRMPKKKKRKDPNEPNKPVSAYALFFRDTQAAIKGQNPNATFGEVSKIVASMWESLDPEHKNVYKKKTELAKKEYLKQLAAYRASLVSQTRVDESPSPPHRSPTGTSPQHMMGYMNNISPQHMGSPAHMGSPGHMGSPAHMVPQSPQHISSPHHITSPQHVSSPPNMLGHHVTSPPHPTMYNQSPAQYNMNPYTNGQSMDMVDHSGMRIDSQRLPPSGNNSGRNMQYGMCIRTGCGNRAIESLGWDNEYCSNECVVSHCRDVFTAWVANRNVPANSYTVK